MEKILNPIEVAIDNEDSDDGFFSVGFILNYDVEQVPHNIGLCRDVYENPDSIYVEPDDQIYGFRTRNATFTVDDLILTISLHDENKFYWDGSKSVKIKLDPKKKADAVACLRRIFDLQP